VTQDKILAQRVEDELYALSESELAKQDGDKDFGFCFEKPPGWAKEEYPSVCANSLREAIANHPSLADLKLAEVWCLRSCNMIWASDNWQGCGEWATGCGRGAETSDHGEK
jgi:hypothetical protein